MIRLGLCCVFKEEDIRFRRTTARYISGLSEQSRARHLSEICLHNASKLVEAIDFCRKSDIGSFRINSQILPLKTHPVYGYSVKDLPEGREILKGFMKAGELAREYDIRLTFHPDQFVVLSSPRAEVVGNSIRELEYQGEVSEWVGADVINIHAGGAYGDKDQALFRLQDGIDRLSRQVRSRLTLENDDRLYSPGELLPLCRKLKIPLVYDVHHHRCHPDGLTEEEATREALATWNREPLFHISSPKDGWESREARKHHDFVAMDDIPRGWLDLDITVEVEAKAKELAVKQMRNDMNRLIFE